MNILWLANTQHPSKADHPTPWVTALANGLMATGNVTINIVTYNQYISHDDELVRDGVKYTFLKVPKDKWDMMRGYTQRIRVVKNYLKDIAGRYDLLHIHGAEQQYQVMGSDLRLPKVLSAQGFIRECYKYLPRKPEYRHLSWLIAGYYEKRYLPTVKHFICRTHWDKSIIRDMQPRAVVHHNWELMRPEFYQPIDRALGRHRNAVLFVGGTNNLKGIREALQVVDKLRRTEPVRLIVTGGGSKAQLLQLATSLSLTNLPPEAIEHRGMLTAAQLWDVYHEAFCLLHPSYIDNSPNSVCEAQLAGLPVVASNVGGVSSLVEHEVTGMLTSLQVNELLRATQQLWESRDLRAQIINQARAVSEERFDRHKIITNTEAIYQKVIQNP
ncbi:glycosyltransferase family 4 protein [Spirosoma rigui]|uniref:glycosyltransferase family 4 protein n=1 Tax=Spirosoma rigui TaxID=564064 RepID=UPI001472B90F|nr:glycosyltransferase family 4 protein [Spirosoma rigui]